LYGYKGEELSEDTYKWYLFEDGTMISFDTEKELLAEVFASRAELGGVRYFYAKELKLKIGLEDIEE